MNPGTLSGPITSGRTLSGWINTPRRTITSDRTPMGWIITSRTILLGTTGLATRLQTSGTMAVDDPDRMEAPVEDQHTKDRRSYDAASVPFSLAGRVFQESAILAAEGGSPLRPIANQLILASERLGQPMRLAVVGQIKRGKSTLVNALLGEDIAATGQLELTFTVSEFRHDETLRLLSAIKTAHPKGRYHGPFWQA